MRVDAKVRKGAQVDLTVPTTALRTLGGEQWWLITSPAGSVKRRKQGGGRHEGVLVDYTVPGVKCQEKWFPTQISEKKDAKWEEVQRCVRKLNHTCDHEKHLRW